MHPSHKEHDLKNIRVNLELPFICLVPPKEMEAEWDKFEEKVLKGRMVGMMYLVSAEGEVLEKEFLPLIKEPFARLMDIFFEYAA